MGNPILTMPLDRSRCYYIVRVGLLPVPKQRFARQYAWLGWSEGYPTHWPCMTPDDAYGAKRFDEPPSLETIRSWSGSPWYDKHDPLVVPDIFRVDERIVYERVVS